MNDSGSPTPARRTPTDAASSPMVQLYGGDPALASRPVDPPSRSRRRLLRGLSATLALGALGLHAALTSAAARADEGDDAEDTAEPVAVARGQLMADGSHLDGWVNGEKAVAGKDGRWGSGNVSLIAMRIDRQEFRVRFKNLRVWEGHWPDPSTVW